MMEFHPLANIFPLIDGDDFVALAADIRAHGLREKIKLYDGMILDGRNRYRACVEVGVDPVFELFDGSDPVAYVISLNLRRRQLNESQRALVADNLANLNNGRPSETAQICAVSQDEAAKELNVSRRSVQTARVVKQNAVAEVVKAIEEGNLSLNAAAAIAKLPEYDQREVLKDARPDRAVKKVARQKREEALAVKQSTQSAPETMRGWVRHGPESALLAGKAAEHIVCADALMRGFNAFLASQGSPYDLVIENEGRLFKIQVKSSQSPRNVNSQGLNPRMAYSFCAMRRGKNGNGPRLTEQDADIIACVALDRGAIAYLPVFECSTTIQLEPEFVAANNYVRTYDKPIGEYPLEDALARVIGNSSYTELKRVFPPFPTKRFGVVYADPPWSFATYSETGMDRSADNHYPTITTDILCGVGPFIPRAEDSVLFLWATSPMLPDALRVLAAWGFDYKSCCVWAKDKIGTGYWFRNAHELLLIGTRGNVPAPAMGDQWPSLIEAPVGAHSAKPEKFAELIEAYFPNLPKIELNRRGPPRVGWDAWGNEAGGA